jgi:hypothetical protein
MPIKLNTQFQDKIMFSLQHNSKKPKFAWKDIDETNINNKGHDNVACLTGYKNNITVLDLDFPRGDLHLRERVWERWPLNGSFRPCFPQKENIADIQCTKHALLRASDKQKKHIQPWQQFVAANPPPLYPQCYGRRHHNGQAAHIDSQFEHIQVHVTPK